MDDRQRTGSPSCVSGGRQPRHPLDAGGAGTVGSYSNSPLASGAVGEQQPLPVNDPAAVALALRWGSARPCRVGS
jgi:hypothetical protein